MPRREPLSRETCETYDSQWSYHIRKYGYHLHQRHLITNVQLQLFLDVQRRHPRTRTRSWMCPSHHTARLRGLFWSSYGVVPRRFSVTLSYCSKAGGPPRPSRPPLLIYYPNFPGPESHSKHNTTHSPLMRSTSSWRASLPIASHHFLVRYHFPCISLLIQGVGPPMMLSLQSSTSHTSQSSRRKLAS